MHIDHLFGLQVFNSETSQLRRRRTRVTTRTRAITPAMAIEMMRAALIALFPATAGGLATTALTVNGPAGWRSTVVRTGSDTPTPLVGDTTSGIGASRPL